MKDRPYSRVRDIYPDLYAVSCPGCKLECNACENCELKEFLECEAVPEGCALKHNVLVRLKG